MNKYVSSLSRILGALLFITTSAFATDNIDMFVGEVKVLGTYQVDRVAVGNGQLLRAEVLDSGELLVIAQSVGSSSLRLWKKDGLQVDFNVRISENDPEKRVRMDSMIRMNVKMVEFRKSALGKLGISWDNQGVNGPAFSTVGDFLSTSLFRSPNNSGISETLPLAVKPFETHFGIATSITSRINYMATNGDAVTLAEPVLTCVNGGSAKFLAGGEIPYSAIGLQGQVSILFKEYGVKLNVSPLADSNGNIYTKILTEVSQIDPATTVLDVPGLITRRTETEMNVKEGNTIVISGLLNVESSKDIDKVAGLGDLPILGNLFKSTDYRNQLSELVVFVTPEVHEPRSIDLTQRDKRVLEDREQRLRDVEKRLEYSILD